MASEPHACENSLVEDWDARRRLHRAAEADGTGERAPSLHVSCENGDVDAARLALDSGADVNRALRGATALYLACEKGHRRGDATPRRRRRRQQARRVRRSDAALQTARIRITTPY